MLKVNVMRGGNRMYEIIQAPMAGGNSTPALVHAVAQAGGLGYLAGGYKTVAALREEIHSLRALGTDYFGVNLFVPRQPNGQTALIENYCEKLAIEATLIHTTIGSYAYSDDEWSAKFQLMLDEKVPVVSFTFNMPTPAQVLRLKKRALKQFKR